MSEKECFHSWEMVNIVNGIIVLKRCFHCSKVSSCFSVDTKPPLEPCREDSHFWNFMEAIGSFHFDLKCAKCDRVVDLGELVGLMACTECDEECDVCMLMRSLKPQGTRICIALGRRPIDERTQLPPEKFTAIEEFFCQQNDLRRANIGVVPHTMVRNIARCYAEAIADVETLFVTAPKGK